VIHLRLPNGTDNLLKKLHLRLPNGTDNLLKKLRGA
jgi:hypothetical protein